MMNFVSKTRKLYQQRGILSLKMKDFAGGRQPRRAATAPRSCQLVERGQISMEKPDFLFKNPEFLFKNPDLLSGILISY